MSGVHVAAERWIRPLPERRDSPIDAGCKEVLRVLWGCVDWSIEREPAGLERPWISREQIAAEIGSTVGAVADRVRKLTAAGWIRWDGRAWSLAWAEPWRVERTDEQPSSADRLLESPPATPVTGDSSDVDRRLQLQAAVTPVTATGDPSRHNQGSQERSQELSHVQADGSHADAGSPTQASGSPTQAEQPALGHPRKTRPRSAAQPSLNLGDEPPERDDVAELLADHERLRAEAMRAHGRDPAGWPGAKTGKGQALRARARKALEQHGPEACRRYLEHRAAEWRDDPGPLLAYPPDQTWSPRIVGPTLERLSRTALARASPRAAIRRITVTAPELRPAPDFAPDFAPETTS